MKNPQIPSLVLYSLSAVHCPLFIANYYFDRKKHLRALGIQRGDFVHDFLRATVRDFFGTIRVLHGEVEAVLIDTLGVYAPAVGGVGEGLLQFDELGEVGIVEWVGLTEVAAGVELVVPDFSGLP